MNDQPTVCGFCSCGCAMYVEPSKDGIVGLCPSATHPVSTGRLCIKGWNAPPALFGPDRLRTPLIRRGNELQPADWKEAIDFTVSAIEKAGPKGVGVIGSAKTTNEECYSLVKLARSVIGTPNVDGACRFYDASLIRALIDTIGTPASQIDLNLLAQARSMLVVGANVMDQLAHVGSRIQDAVENGCKVVAADPRRSRLAPQTALFLQPQPGTDLVWLRALVKTIIDRKLYFDGAAELAGFEELRVSLDDVDMGRLADACGIDKEMVTQAAETLAGDGPPIVMFGLGVLQQHESTQVVKALADVAVLLGGAVMPLRGQNNAQGACDMGLLHDMLPGYGALSDPEARRAWEKVWDCDLPAEPGMSAVEMLRACQSGDLKALLIFGENVALSAPNTEATAKALENVEFLAVSDLYLTETARLANVVFPACSFLEKDGTFTNIERRVQRVRKAVKPIGESKPDLHIISELAAALGKRMPKDAAAVMSEISSNVRQYVGVSYDALDEVWGGQWLRDSEAAKLAPIPAGPVERDEEYPLRLVAGRVNYHQQTGTMSAKSAVLAREYPEAYAELNEADAEKLSVRSGGRVRISSRSGSVTRSIVLSDSIRPGSVHVPVFFGGDSPNALASYDCDAVSGAPVYKACAVKVEAVK